eukprot:scaffold279136_cov36-Tisochrysis_lutea.AAC.1
MAMNVELATTGIHSGRPAAARLKPTMQRLEPTPTARRVSMSSIIHCTPIRQKPIRPTASAHHGRERTTVADGGCEPRLLRAQSERAASCLYVEASTMRAARRAPSAPPRTPPAAATAELARESIAPGAATANRIE